MESRYDFRLETQYSVLKIFTTTKPKNVMGILFDKQVVVLINKTSVTNFGSVLIEILIFEIDTLKSIGNHEIWRYNRILSNFDWISN